MGQNDVISEETLRRIEEAARHGAAEGAKKEIQEHGFGGRGRKRSPILSWLLGILVIVLLVFVVFPEINPMNKLKSQLSREDDVEDHDLTLENDGILGYTVADFADAILGDHSQLTKLEVYQQEVSDVVTITDAGLGKFKVFSKCQLVTYHGTATYTVDLSALTADAITLDEDSKTITMKIPAAELEPINIRSEDIEFGDVEHGLLAFGDIKMTQEESTKVQTTAEQKMNEKLEEENAVDEANRFAEMSVWEIFQPVINGVDTGYTLKVEIE